LLLDDWRRTVPYAQPTENWRLRYTPDAVHLDLRGLEPPEPMVAILKLIDGGEAGPVLVAHLDREPIFLYPELDDRGWAHEILPPECGDADCEHAVRLRLVRLTE
jgi:hypothetical protein